LKNKTMKKILLAFLFLPLVNFAQQLADGIYVKFITNKGEILCQLEYQKVPL